MTHRAVIITGSNLGDKAGYLRQVRERLGEEAGEVVAASAIYESEPWGAMEEDAGSFMNQVLVLETELEPLELLERTQEIERRLGRTEKGGCGDAGTNRTVEAGRSVGLSGRADAGKAGATGTECAGNSPEPGPDPKERVCGRMYSSRTMDIDILYYDEMVMRTERLELPHPKIAIREFVLAPLAEVLPGYRHPVVGKTTVEMLAELKL